MYSFQNLSRPFFVCSPYEATVIFRQCTQSKNCLCLNFSSKARSDTNFRLKVFSNKNLNAPVKLEF